MGLDFFGVAGFSYFDFSREGDQFKLAEPVFVLNYLDLPSEPFAQWKASEEDASEEAAGKLHRSDYGSSKLKEFAQKGLASTVLLHTEFELAGSNSYRLARHLNQKMCFMSDK